MDSTYSQVYIHIIFAVKGIDSLICKSWEIELFKYVSGLLKNKKQKVLSINGMPDHIHIVIGMSVDCCLSDLVREIKKSSNKFINENLLSVGHFQWQSGYGAFSSSRSRLSRLLSNIQHDKIKHQKISFKEEYLELLNANEIDYKEEYLFEWIDY